MLVLLPLLMAYSLIGETAHEWIGIGMFVLFISHQLMNRQWYKNIWKGKYNSIRIVGTVVNLLLFLIMISLMISGYINSRHVFIKLPLKGDAAFGRTLHLIAAYWGLVIMAFHAGMHGSYVIGMLRKLLKRSVVTKAGTVIPKIFAVILSIWGISAFIRRQIGSYMFFQSQFVFFDYTEPKIFFLADYIAIMCLFAFFGYYLSRVLTYLQRKNKQ